MERNADRVFAYNVEAIDQINLSRNGNQAGLQKLKIYFHAKAGEVAVFIFERTKDTSWAVDSYKNYRASAELSVKT